MSDSAPGSYEVEIEEVEYLRHRGKSYPARIFRPKGEGPFPAVVEAHGGAWARGNRSNNDTINKAVASGGVVVAALEFRNPPDATYPGSVADVNYGVRWLKANASRFNAAPWMVGSMGTSSGGHLVVLAGLKPDDARYAAIPLAGTGDFDARVPYVVALWPVICPVSRYRVLEERLAAGQDNERWRELMDTQMLYWLSEDAMEEGSPNFAVRRGDRLDKPNILYLQHPSDPIHPRENLDSFVAGYRDLGGNLELEFFDGENYDQPRSAPESESARDTIGKIIAFIHREAASAAKIAAE